MEGKVKIKKVNKNRIEALILAGVVLVGAVGLRVNHKKQISDSEIMYEQSVEEEYTEDDLIAINYLQEFKNRVDFITQNEYDGYAYSPEVETRDILNKVGNFVFFHVEVNGVNYDDLSNRGKKEVVEMAKYMYHSLRTTNYITDVDTSFDDDNKKGDEYIFFDYIDELVLDQGISTFDKTMQTLHLAKDPKPINWKIYYLEKLKMVKAGSWLSEQEEKVENQISKTR